MSVTLAEYQPWVDLQKKVDELEAQVGAAWEIIEELQRELYGSSGADFQEIAELHERLDALA